MKPPRFNRWLTVVTVSLLFQLPLPHLTPITEAQESAGGGTPLTFQRATLLSAQAFTVEEPYRHLWRADRAAVTNGSVIVIQADAEITQPRQGFHPYLFVGEWPAEAINFGTGSGRVVALVPLPPSALAEVPIYYANPEILPEALTPEDARATLAAALAAGLLPPSTEELSAALAAGGFQRSPADHHTLRRSVAELVAQFSPQEHDLAHGLQVPQVPRRDVTQRDPAQRDATQRQSADRRSLTPQRMPSLAARGAKTDRIAQRAITGLITTDLAGGALGAYPFFEYVSAFNAGATIEVAIDTGRFPALAGTTVDLYVVAAKTRAQWNADPALNDLTATIESPSFTAGTISSNRLTVDTGTLSADAGIGLGVGYDVVIDVDRDGTLSAGDVIDGFGDEAGFYVVHDVTQPGPLAVTEVTYTGGAFLGQNTFYPTDIDSLGELPLVVVSHGNGHNYQWYDHIGNHLASYGYVVMSHQNNTIPGIETASQTTLTNTEYFLGNLDLIESGVLAGHIDTRRITWIGHSRGGEGITRAYDRVLDNDFVPAQFGLDQLALLSSIAPTDFLGPNNSNPHGVPFHLWVGGADNDVSGCASSGVGQSFTLLDRASGARQSLSLHGVGHGDFHNGGGSSVATGPCLVGRSDTHTIMRGYLLPLVEHYIEDSVPAEDFLWRQWESFRPLGAPTSPCVVADLYYRLDDSATRVIDDFETEPASDVSSSGGSVSFNVTDLTEDLLNDGNTNFSDAGAVDPMNGMTVADFDDASRGIVFSFESNRFLEFGLNGADRNLLGYEYVSFRGCQQTRHPLTLAELGDTTFTVTLRDGNGATSSINIGAYGGGLEEPYQRGGCGTGTGWNNEFETVRVRLADFLHDGSGIDLSDVRAVRFSFGPAFGSPSGRIGLDQIELTLPIAPLFADGFEAGDFTAWSNVVP
ncbi:MAG: hypothetical protein AAF560_03080 [Acidobacteriota bacterium]